MSKSLVEMAADIVQSQSASKSMSPEEIATALQSTYKTLQALQMNESCPCDTSATKATPDMTPAQSIQKNKIICLECGEGFKMLSPKHLQSHGLDGRGYRQKHGLKLRQPLCAKALSANRSKAGKERGIPVNLEKAIAEKKEKGIAKRAAAAGKKAPVITVEAKKTASPKKSPAAKKTTASKKD